MKQNAKGTIHNNLFTLLMNLKFNLSTLQRKQVIDELLKWNEQSRFNPKQLEILMNTANAIIGSSVDSSVDSSIDFNRLICEIVSVSQKKMPISNAYLKLSSPHHNDNPIWSVDLVKQITQIRHAKAKLEMELVD